MCIGGVSGVSAIEYLRYMRMCVCVCVINTYKNLTTDLYTTLFTSIKHFRLCTHESRDNRIFMTHKSLNKNCEIKLKQTTSNCQIYMVLEKL